METLLLVLRLLAAGSLYAFLITIISMLRNDLQASSIRGTAVERSARLIVLPTADQLLEAGAAFGLRPVTSLGRGPANTISIPDDYASTRHALISWRGGQWWIEDLASRNGTLLNGASVTKPTVLAAGDIVAIGRSEFRLECEDGSWSEG